MEDRIFEQSRGLPRTIGASFWSTNTHLFEPINQRHGVLPDEVCVYSIKAYQQEISEIDAEWQRLVEEMGWTRLGGTGPDADEKQSAWIRWLTRRADCKARHFPGFHSLGPKTIDTRPKLWIYITALLLCVRETILGINGVDKSRRPTRCPEDVVEVYGIMRRRKIPWTPPPPYPYFTEEEADHELLRIANQLKHRDLVNSQTGRCGGTWLTDKGLDLINRIRPPKKP